MEGAGNLGVLAQAVTLASEIAMSSLLNRRTGFLRVSNPRLK